MNVEDIVEVVLVGGSTRIPLVRSAVRNLFRAEPQDRERRLGQQPPAGLLGQLPLQRRPDALAQLETTA